MICGQGRPPTGHLGGMRGVIVRTTVNETMSEQELTPLRRLAQLRDFRLYVVGNLNSNLATWMQKIAVGWLAWELTESTTWLGLIALAEAIPTLALSLLAGTIIDRVDYFRLLKLAQLAIVTYAAVMAITTAIGMMTIGLLMVLSFLRGTAGAFYRPARMTVVYALVGKPLLAQALAVNAIIFNGSRFIGPALGGLLIVTWGVEAALFAVFFMYLVYSLVLSLINVVPEESAPHKSGLLRETVNGLSYISTHPGIRLNLLLLLGLALLARPVIELLPGVADLVFNAGANGLAILLSANGAGALLGAFFLATRRGSTEGMALLSFNCLLAAGLSLVVLITIPGIAAGAVAAAALGLALIVYNVSNQTLIQSAVAPAMRGRVLSVYGLLNQGMPAIGALLIGLFAEFWGLKAPILVSGTLCIAAGLLTVRYRRYLVERLESQ